MSCRGCRNGRGVLSGGYCGGCIRERGEAVPRHHHGGAKPRKEHETCGGPRTPDKRRFGTLAYVLRHTENIKARTGRDMYAYRCPDCGSWHATKRPPTVPLAPKETP